MRANSHFLYTGSIFLCVASFGLTAILLLFYPYGANYGEAPLLSQALKIEWGQNIYKPSLQTPPYVIANYPPLYPSVIGAIHHLAHLPLFFTGRVLSILATLISSVILGRMTRRLFNASSAGYLAAALFLGHPYVGLWSGLVRVDALALAFSLGGFWIAYSRWRSPTWLAIALTCLLASIFTRQTYLLAAPFASSVWLLYNDRKRGIIFAVTLGLLVFATFLILNKITLGGFFQHIVIANVNRYSFDRTLRMEMLFFFTAPALFILTTIAIRKIARGSIDPFFTWGLLPYTGAALLTTLTVGKIGSDINYFLELVAGSVIWAAGLFYQKPVRLARILLVIQTFWSIAFTGVIFQVPLYKLWNNIPEMDLLSQKVRVAAQIGPVLADVRLDLLVLDNQEINYQPFEYTQLYNAGIWDPTAFIEEIASGKFSLILIHSGDTHLGWPPPVIEAILGHNTCMQQSGLLVCQP